MLKVGLTGGIGSGKSTIANLFAELGIPISDADKIAHQLSEPEQTAYIKIVQHFGEQILEKNKQINRGKLKSIVFNNPDKRQLLESILHPLIRKKMQEEIASYDSPYCILVIPLLTEVGNISYIDRVLVVDSPEHLQIERTAARDQLTEQIIKDIMQSQVNRQQRLYMADDVIYNDNDLKSLEKQVNQLHKRYLELTSAQ